MAGLFPAVRSRGLYDATLLFNASDPFRPLWPSLSVSDRIPPLFSTTKKEAIVTVQEIIQTEHAPNAIGPYSQAVKANGLIFASGQIPIDPQTGQFVAGGVYQQNKD